MATPGQIAQRETFVLQCHNCGDVIAQVVVVAVSVVASEQSHYRKMYCENCRA